MSKQSQIANNKIEQYRFEAKYISYTSNISATLFAGAKIAGGVAICKATVGLGCGAGIVLIKDGASAITDNIGSVLIDINSINDVVKHAFNIHDLGQEYMTSAYLHYESVENFIATLSPNIAVDYYALRDEYIKLIQAIPQAQASVHFYNAIEVDTDGNMVNDTFEQVMLDLAATPSPIDIPTSSLRAIYNASKDASNLEDLDTLKATFENEILKENNEILEWFYYADKQLTEYKNYFQSQIPNAPKASFTLNKTSANIGDTITATSTSTDEDEDDLTHTWTLTKPNGSSSTLSSTSNSTTSFIIDIAGSYSLKLKVSDGSLEDDNTDSVVVEGIDYTPTPINVGVYKSIDSIRLYKDSDATRVCTRKDDIWNKGGYGNKSIKVNNITYTFLISNKTNGYIDVLRNGSCLKSHSFNYDNVYKYDGNRIAVKFSYSDLDDDFLLKIYKPEDTLSFSPDEANIQVNLKRV